MRIFKYARSIKWQCLCHYFLRKSLLSFTHLHCYKAKHSLNKVGGVVIVKVYTIFAFINRKTYLSLYSGDLNTNHLNTGNMNTKLFEV